MKVKKRLLVSTLTMLCIMAQVGSPVALAASNKDITALINEVGHEISVVVEEDTIQSQSVGFSSSRTSRGLSGYTTNKSTEQAKPKVTITEKEDLKKSDIKSKKKVDINHRELILGLGDQYKLKITGVKDKIKWKSNKPSVAKVSSNGTVTAVSAGKSSITASLADKKFICNITVLEDARDIQNVSTIDGQNQANLLLELTYKPENWASPLFSLGICDDYYYYYTIDKMIYALNLSNGKNTYLCSYKTDLVGTIGRAKDTFSIYENKIYYINDYGNIVRADLNNTNKEVIIEENIKGFYINDVNGDKKLFAINSNNQALLYTLDSGNCEYLKGTFKNLAYTNSTSGFYYYVTGDRYGGVFAVSKKTGETTELWSPKGWSGVYRNIFISENYSYYTISDHTSSTRYLLIERNGKVYAEQDVTSFNAWYSNRKYYGDYEYFIEPDTRKLYRIKNGSNNKKLIHEMCDDYVFINNKLYSYNSRSGQITSMDPSGKNKSDFASEYKGLSEIYDKLGGKTIEGNPYYYKTEAAAKKAKEILLKTAGHRIGDSYITYGSSYQKSLITDFNNFFVLEGTKNIIRGYVTYGGIQPELCDILNYYDVIALIDIKNQKTKVIFEAPYNNHQIDILTINEKYVVFKMGYYDEKNELSKASIYAISLSQYN